jgi:hypothetical protein
MPVLNTADDLRFGSSAVDAVYLGSTEVWSSGDPDATAFLSAAGITDPTQSDAVTALVVALKAASLWTKMKAVWPMVGGTASTHKWNLIDPRDLDAAFRLTFYTGGHELGSTHSTALGYIPNPVDNATNGGYADTHLVPLTHLAQNDTHLSFYGTRNTAAGDKCDMGAYNWDAAAGRFHIIGRYIGDAFYYGMAEGGATAVTNTDASGLLVATRTASNAQAAYRNGSQLGSSTGSSIGLPTTSVLIGAINGYTTGTTDRSCGFASVGSGLTAQNVADLYTAVQAFQTTLGRQV